VKITYEFATETIEIEVDETYYDVLIEFEREEKNLNRKHERRYPVSLEHMDYEGMDFADGVDVLEDCIKSTDREALQKAIEVLLPAQQDLIKRVFFQEFSLISIARKEGVTEAAVRDRLKRIYKKLKKVLE
jgi:RNA polymerase sigma factor (sigma-70 family)